MTPRVASMARTERPDFINTLSGRFVLLSAGVAIMAAVVTMAVSIPLISGAAEAQAKVALDRLADITVEALQRPGPPGGNRQLEGLLRSQQVTGYVVSADSQSAPGVSEEIQEEIIAGRSLSSEVTVDGSTQFLVARPIDGSFGLVLLAPAQVATEPADEAIRRLVLALVVGVAVAVAIGYLASKQVTKPLRRAADTAERLTSGERGLRLDPGGPVEVADIATSLNDLSAALAVSESRQREFLLSVSHELRTPLTAVRGYAEALADGMVDSDDVVRTGEIMTSEADRLDRLVADLLALARLGAVDFAIDVVRFDLNQLLGEAADVWRSRCEREGVLFSQELPDDSVDMRSDPVRIRQIIDNLAENALRVTPAGQSVVFSLRPEAEGAAITVRDGGPGLTEEDMAVAFEPAALFSRYRGIRPVGSGLGLALVGRLAARLGGSAVVGNSSEGGAAFTVRLSDVPDEVGETAADTRARQR
jgi:two-component system OmpR family sensor kinase